MMPTYVYRCPVCELQWETTHSMTDNTPVLHTACEAEAVRVPQTTGVVLKGDGWAGKGNG